MSTKKPQLDWINTSTLILFHLLAVAAIVYLATVQCSPWTLGLGVLWFVFSGLSITAGYHRLFSHRSYRAHPVVRALLLAFGAAAVQNSALRWCADHRRHHAHTDREGDPYNAMRGFFWSHIGWVMYQPVDKVSPGSLADLEADPLVVLQDRYYILIAFVTGAVLPACLGLIWGDWLGALLVAGFLRLAVEWHATFSINSVAHLIGNQPYSTKNSSRNSFWTAILTLGEGYHNFHHAFQHDYRNGICWYHYDPTKWLLWSLDKVGLASNLRRVPDETIERRRQQVLEQREGSSASEPQVSLPSPSSANKTAAGSQDGAKTSPETVGVATADPGE